MAILSSLSGSQECYVSASQIKNLSEQHCKSNRLTKLAHPQRSTTETAKTKTHRQKQQTGKPRAQKGEAPQGTQNHTRDRGRQKKHEKSWTAQEKGMQDAEEL